MCKRVCPVVPRGFDSPCVHVKCALCKKKAAGTAGSWDRDNGQVRLCHDDYRSCYHLWTVYGLRPGDDVDSFVAERPFLRQYWPEDV
jgi:hypothetical protein